MADQFRNIDRPSAPQAVTVTLSRVVERDDAAGVPDCMQDGFWPSRDATAAGYVPPRKFAAELRKAKARYEAWERGDWYYCGVYCRADVSVPIGQGSFTLYTIKGPGLWGIESDSGSYLDEVYEDQKAELIEQLRTMGAAFVELTDDK